MPPIEYVEIDFDEFECETEKAYLFIVEGEKIWIPKSICRDIDEDLNTVYIPEWFAEQEDLI